MYPRKGKRPGDERATGTTVQRRVQNVLPMVVQFSTYFTQLSYNDQKAAYGATWVAM